MSSKIAVNFYNSEVYGGYYEMFKQYSREDSEWIKYIEESFVENGFYDSLGLPNIFKSDNEHVDIRFDDSELESPSEIMGYKKAKEVIDLRIFTPSSNLGNVVLYLIHPKSKNLGSYIGGFKKAWEEMNSKTPIIIVAPE